MQSTLSLAGLSTAMLIASLAVTAVALARIPADYFAPGHERPLLAGQPAPLRWCALGLKNLAGLLLVVLGVVMSLPGVPGQGLITTFLGITWLDVPGKRRLERRIVQRPMVLRTINRLRARFAKPPLVL